MNNPTNGPEAEYVANEYQDLENYSHENVKRF